MTLQHPASSIQDRGSSLQALLAGPRHEARRRSELDDVRGGEAPRRLPLVVRRILACSLPEVAKRQLLAQYRAQQAAAGNSTLEIRHPSAAAAAQCPMSNVQSVAAAIGADPRRRMYAWVVAHWPGLTAGLPGAAHATPHHVEQSSRTLFVSLESATARYLVQPHLATLTARLREATGDKLLAIRLVAGGDTVRALGARPSTLDHRGAQPDSRGTEAAPTAAPISNVQCPAPGGAA